MRERLRSHDRAALWFERGGATPNGRYVTPDDFMAGLGATPPGDTEELPLQGGSLRARRASWPPLWESSAAVTTTSSSIARQMSDAVEIADGDTGTVVSLHIARRP